MARRLISMPGSAERTVRGLVAWVEPWESVACVDVKPVDAATLLRDERWRGYTITAALSGEADRPTVHELHVRCPDSPAAVIADDRFGYWTVRVVGIEDARSMAEVHRTVRGLGLVWAPDTRPGGRPTGARKIAADAFPARLRQAVEAIQRKRGSGNQPEQARVAAELGVSVRTLRAYLAHERAKTRGR